MTKNWRYQKIEETPYENYLLSDSRLNLKVYNPDKYLTKNIYRKWYSYVAKKQLDRNETLYDIQSFSKTMILALIWNNSIH